MKKNESGRSMVEMLGVLAIIGVLSVGGIAGYTLAMGRYRVNEAVHTVAMAGVACATANAQINLDDFENDFVTELTCMMPPEGQVDRTLEYTLADNVTVAAVEDGLAAENAAIEGLVFDCRNEEEEDAE